MNHLIEPVADSVANAAKRLGISRSALYIELKAGRMKALKAGRRTIVPRVSQSQWLSNLSDWAAAA